MLQLNPREFQIDQQNDAADWYSLLFEAIVMMADQSQPGEYKKALGSVSRRQGPPNLSFSASNNELLELGLDSTAQMANHLQDGYSSEIYKLFAVQVVQEARCGDQTCNVIKRSFTHEPGIVLSFQDFQTPMSLSEMLQDWFKTVTDRSGSYEGTDFCEFHNHKRPLKKWKRITQCPPILKIQFTRGNRKFQNHVDLLEFLDLHEYADGVGTSLSKPQHDQESELCVQAEALCVFHGDAKGRHYVAYCIVAGVWVRFDDMDATPREEHPQTGLNEGGIPYFVMYEQWRSMKTLPLDAILRRWSTADRPVEQSGFARSPKITDYSKWAPNGHRTTCPYRDLNGCRIFIAHLNANPPPKDKPQYDPNPPPSCHSHSPIPRQ